MATEFIPAELTGIVEDVEQLVAEEMPNNRFLDKLNQASRKLEVRG